MTTATNSVTIVCKSVRDFRHFAYGYRGKVEIHSGLRRTFQHLIDPARVNRNDALNDAVQYANLLNEEMADADVEIDVRV